MTRENLPPGRLGFVELALNAFAFLLHMGFTVVRREATLVRFESDAVFVTVYHGRASYDVGLEIGRLNNQEKYSLHELLATLAEDEVDKARYQTNKADLLERYLTDIALTVDRRCRDLLVGNVSVFEILEQTTSVSRRALTLQAQYGAVIDRADEAWEDKNYSQAAELYEAGAPALDETRRRRLEYLRQKNTGGD